MYASHTTITAFHCILGVIVENEADTAKLLRADNINQEKLFEYAREAADFATEYQMPHLDFAVNHYGKPDVAMFDFTSMFQVLIGFDLALIYRGVVSVGSVGSAEPTDF